MDTTKYTKGDYIRTAGTYGGIITEADEKRNPAGEPQVVVTIKCGDQLFTQRYTANERFGWILDRDLKALGFTKEQRKDFDPQDLIGKRVSITLIDVQGKEYPRLDKITLVQTQTTNNGSVPF